MKMNIAILINWGVFFMVNSYAQTTDLTPYCVYQPNSGSYNMWEYIKIGNQTYNFGSMGSFGQNIQHTYFDNVDFQEIEIGSDITIELKPYSINDLEPMYFALFIDFDKNNSFETDEIVMQNSVTTMAPLPSFGASANAIVKTISISSFITPGTYRMRLIRDGFGGFTYSNNYVITNTCVPSSIFGYGNAYDFNLEFSNPLLVNETDQSKVSILGNVVEDIIHLSSNECDGCTYEITSLVGRLIKQGELTTEIEVVELLNSTYFLSVYNLKKEKVYFIKFFKQ